MKVLHINFYDDNGGAAKTAYRLHKSLLKLSIDSELWVSVAKLGDKTVISPRSNIQKILPYVRAQIGSIFVNALLRTKNLNLHTAAIIPSSLPYRINKSNCDIVHLHWVGGEMISISDIAKIKKPIVWTFHDMWAFCGAEHVTYDERWKFGYLRNNKLKDYFQIDFNRWIWLLKKYFWRRKFHIVAPSQWMFNCVSSSVLFSAFPLSLIHNPIDINKWNPVDKEAARNILGLPTDKRLLLFGAMGGASDLNKGFDLLLGAINKLKFRSSELELVIFGQLEPPQPYALSYKIHYLGRLHDDAALKLVYSAADAMVIPSRVDNFPNTAIEAQACGTPLIGFTNTGLSDIIKHKKTGYLANAGDVIDLSRGIEWAIDSCENNLLRENSRGNAVENFSDQIIADKYIAKYRSILNEKI